MSEEHQPGGIDPDLVPYLEEADAPDPLSLTDVSGEDESTREAMRALAQASLLAGPLEGVLDDLDTEKEDAGEPDPLDQAAADVVARARANQIYASIIERAPEHRFAPTLERIRRVLEWMGDPQLAYTTVHVAGTNGKTSVARMIDALAAYQGFRTGRFTSPHLVSPRERISIDGEPISVAGFVRAWEDVEPFIEMVDRDSLAASGPRMSFFECFTAMAFQAFADAPVDLGVIEVGMGGTWDCTNVLSPAVSVITSISYDHEAWLGHTIEEIAANKAGIIQPGGMVVVGRQSEAALAVIEDRAREVGATVRLLGRDFDVVAIEPAVGGSLICVRTPAALYNDIYVPLLGAHQADNAVLALAAYEVVRGGGALPPAAVEGGFATVTSPGRLEVVRSSPTILVDAAHNPGGAEALRAALEDSFTFTRLVGVYAAMADKNVEGVLGAMEPVLDSIVVTGLDTPRALEVDALAAIAGDVFGPERVVAEADLASAIAEAVAQTEDTGDPAASTGVVCFGSVVLAGAVREMMSSTLKEWGDA